MITVSFGVAELQSGEVGGGLLGRSDKAIYADKQLCRNLVVATCATQALALRQFSRSASIPTH